MLATNTISYLIWAMMVKVGIIGAEWRQAWNAFVWFRMELRRVMSFWVPRMGGISLIDKLLNIQVEFSSMKLSNDIKFTYKTKYGSVGGYSF